MGSLETSHTTPARVSTSASQLGELALGGGSHQRCPRVDHLLGVSRAAEAGDAFRAERPLQGHRRRQAIGRDEALAADTTAACGDTPASASEAITSAERGGGHREEHRSALAMFPEEGSSDSCAGSSTPGR